MKIQLECLQCSLRQATEAAQNATGDKSVQEAILDDCMKLIASYRGYATSPALARDIHNVVKRYTGIFDPYREKKDAAIAAALRGYDTIKSYIGEEPRLMRALKASVTGNSIDLSICGDVDVSEVIRAELPVPFEICDIDIFSEKLRTAKSLLIIADNAGESVFDRAMIEALPPLSVTYAVKSAPIINDVTAREAYSSGLDGCSTVISSGCDLPGTVLDECSDEFMSVFRTADIVISKGQGNFETLENIGRDIFYLLKAKCLPIVCAFGVPQNSYVFKYEPMPQA